MTGKYPPPKWLYLNNSSLNSNDKIYAVVSSPVFEAVMGKVFSTITDDLFYSPSWMCKQELLDRMIESFQWCTGRHICGRENGFDINKKGEIYNPECDCAELFSIALAKINKSNMVSRKQHVHIVKYYAANPQDHRVIFRKSSMPGCITIACRNIGSDRKQKIFNERIPLNKDNICCSVEQIICGHIENIMRKTGKNTVYRIYVENANDFIAYDNDACVYKNIIMD